VNAFVAKFDELMMFMLLTNLKLEA